jgi:hypothetical protein
MFLPTLSKTRYISVVKFPASTSGHITKTSPVRCHLQIGVHVVHPLQDQTGGSRRVPDVGREQDVEEQSQHIFATASRVRKVV